jgi:hypothetical protein
MPQTTLNGELTRCRTFFQTADSWPMHDYADPLNGWSLKDVLDTSSGPATADVYGKLFYHVRAELGTFLRHISDLRMSFRLFQEDASSLPEHVEYGSFDRIEVRDAWSWTIYMQWLTICT